MTSVNARSDWTGWREGKARRRTAEANNAKAGGQAAGGGVHGKEVRHEPQGHGGVASSDVGLDGEEAEAAKTRGTGEEEGRDGRRGDGASGSGKGKSSARRCVTQLRGIEGCADTIGGRGQAVTHNEEGQSGDAAEDRRGMGDALRLRGGHEGTVGEGGR